MTRTYRDIATGKEIDIHVYGNEFLDKITLGLFEKMGITNPLSSEECKIIARILRNNIKYQEEYMDNLKVNCFEFHGIKKEWPEFITHLKEDVLPFFENAEKGIINPDVD